MSTTSLRRLAVPIVAAVAVAGCSKQAPPPPQRPAPEVTVVTVQPQTIPLISSFVAQTESSRQVDIVARVSGFLDKIAYKEGDLVREGQLLFQLDPKPFQAQLEAARGELQAQQARFKTAEATLARVKPLAAQNALSQADLDKAQGEYDASKAAVFAAQAKVTEAELNLGLTRRDQGDQEEAFEHLRRALLLDPGIRERIPGCSSSRGANFHDYPFRHRRLAGRDFRYLHVHQPAPGGAGHRGRSRHR
jgi:multidrug efflux pump subunit AcrA (membrane-fusion protein)